MKTFLIIIIILAVLGVIAWWWIETTRPETPSENYGPSAGNQVQQEDDSTASISNDLQSVDVGNVDSDFQEIDKELNNL